MHYPVINKRGDTIASAITNLDLHDIARAGRTYGVRGFFVVTPVADQHALAKEIIGHWTDGHGAAYNPDRRDALSEIRVVDAISDAAAAVEALAGSRPETVATCARYCRGAVSHAAFSRMVRAGRPYLMLFGTAWGLSKGVIEGADHVLAPIRGDTDYNHLSVRSAVSILLDRLLGRRETA